MQPAYYEDFEEIKNKIWSMFDNAIKDRGSQFRIPVFICGDQDDFDGRIVVLRKSDRENNLVQYHSDIRSDKIAKLKTNKNAAMLFSRSDFLRTTILPSKSSWLPQMNTGILNGEPLSLIALSNIDQILFLISLKSS